MKEKEKVDTSMPIYDSELEKNILGHLIHCSNVQIRDIRDKISSEYFYHDSYRNVYRLICKLNDDGLEVDPTVLMPEIMKRNVNGTFCTMQEFAHLISSGYVSIIELHNHIPIFVDYAKRRKLWTLAQMMLSNGISVGSDVEQVVERVKDGLEEILHGKNVEDYYTLTSTVKEVQKTVEDNINGISQGVRFNTGFSWLDKKGGMQSSDLIIIAAETSMGKTSFADSMVLNMIQEGCKLLFVSMEMTRQQLTARLLSHYTKLYSNQMLTQALNSYELQQFDRGVGDIMRFSDNLFFADDSVCTIDQVISNIRKVVAKHGVKGVVIDYLQMLSGMERGQSVEQFRGACARRLKNIAKELNIFVVALSQLNRDKENPEPSLSRLRDSGQIAEASDMVILIYRPQYYIEQEGKTHLKYPYPHENASTTGTAMITLAKGRNVGVGSFICGFNANETHFYDLNTIPSERDNPRTIHYKEDDLIDPNNINDKIFL